MNDDNQDESEEKWEDDPGDQRNKRKRNELSLKEQVKRLTAALAQRDETNAQQAVEIAQQAVEIKVLSGTYFHTIDSVFPKKENQELNPCLEDYTNVCRKSLRSQGARSFRGRNGIDDYAITFKEAMSDNGVAAIAKTTRSSTHGSQKEDIWPTNLFGESIERTEIAHLVPASVDNANTYWFVTDFLFGCKERTWAERQRLIHGVKTDRRIPHTGIKHSVANKFLLAGQGEDFDRNPNVLIIPILDVDQAKNWANEGYEAIILIDTTDGTPLKKIAESSQFNDVPGSSQFNDVPGSSRFTSVRTALNAITASADDIRKAHKLVKAYTKAIVYAQTNLARHQVSKEVFEKDPFPKIEIFDQFRKAYETKLPADVASLKVRKIKFAGHEQAGGHPAPDPILLVTRAANQLQRRRGIKLVAAAEPQEDEDDRDELSVLAEEMFLEKRRFLRERELMGIDIVFQPIKL